MSIVVALIAAGCSGSSGGAIVESGDSSQAGSSTSVVEPTIPTVAPTATSASSQATAAGFSRTTDVHYLTLNGVELFMDVYTPMGKGPWPVVVAFHGLSSALKDAATNTVVAEEAAARGMVVFAPSWIAGEPFPLTIEDITMLNQAAKCSVAFAQQHAADFRGDPARTVVYGFSAGAGPALVAALEPSTATVPGCQTAAIPDPVVGVVLGDGEYFFHSENFDGAFQADLAPMQAVVASWTDPTSWPVNLDAGFSLWVAADATARARSMIRRIPPDGLHNATQPAPSGVISTDWALSTMASSATSTRRIFFGSGSPKPASVPRSTSIREATRHSTRRRSSSITSKQWPTSSDTLPPGLAFGRTR